MRSRRRQIVTGALLLGFAFALAAWLALAPPPLASTGERTRDSNAVGATPDASSLRRPSAAARVAAPGTSEAADAVGPAPAAAPASRFDVRFVRRDAFGLTPRHQHTVQLGPDGGPLACWQLFGRGVGSVEHAFPARTSALSLVVEDGLLRRVELRSGATAVVEVREPRSSALLDDADPWFAAWQLGPPPPSADELVSHSSAPSPLAGALFEEVPAAVGSVWRAGFGLPMREPSFSLSGVVLAPDGTPARDVRVRLVHRGVDAEVTDGSFVFRSRLPRASHEIEAGSLHGGSVRTRVALRADTRVTLQLVAGPAVRGRVVDPAGAPLANANVVWIAPDGEWRQDVRTAADGAFTLPDLRSGQGVVWACAPADGVRLPAAGSAASPGDHVVLTVDPARCAAALRVLVAVPHHVDPANVSLRVWQAHSGLGLCLRPAALSATHVGFGADGLPAGEYRLELYAPRLGVVDGGRVWCPGEGRVEVGPLVLPALTPVHFRADAAPDAFELVRTLDALGVLCPREGDLAGPHWLGPGRYTLHWRDPRGAAARTFVVAPGAAALDVALR